MNAPVVSVRTRSGPDSARTLWDRARAAADQGHTMSAIKYCRRALLRCERDCPEDAELHAGILLTYAYQCLQTGDPAQALQLIDLAEPLDPDRAGFLHATRGSAMTALGRNAEALEQFSLAVANMSGQSHRERSTILLNRGSLLMTSGRLPEARSDTALSAEIAAADEDPIGVFMARHNLGYIRFLEGDLPGALDEMAVASRIAPDASLGVPALDRARVLAAAGLFSEAQEAADHALRTFTENRAAADLVDALLVAGELALLTGAPGAARRYAFRAGRSSRRGGNHPAALLSRLLALRAEAEVVNAPGPERGGRSRQTWQTAARRADQLAGELAAAGLADECRTARLLQADLSLAAGDAHGAREAAGMAGSGRRRALAGRLHTRLVAAKIALADGRTTAGLTQVRRGLDDLAEFQSRFGSQDLQTAASVHGRTLARIGLRTAVETGSPATILQWLERSRATTTRLPVVRPSADPELAADLGALRLAVRAEREAALSGRPDPAAQREVVAVRMRIRSRAWTASGTGEAIRPIGLREAQRALHADGSSRVLAYFHGAGHLHALVISSTRATYRRLGGRAPVDDTLRRVAADLDLLAAPRVNAAVRSVAGRSLDAGLSEIHRMLVEPVADLLGDGPIRLVASGETATAPWSLLPGLRGRPLTVTASVTAAMAPADGPPAHRVGVLAVAGPDVRQGPAEVAAVGSRHAGAVVLTGESATGQAVLQHAPHGGLLHIAAHGHHVAESPLFSSVFLADGPLFGYDIAPNPALPAQVVLSSCDVGRNAERPGGEPLGLAAALLRSGVQTVIAGANRVADTVAATVMTAYHHELAAGASPAHALAAAIDAAGDQPAPFTCFGVGL